jgi:hypothetical protein
VDTWTLELAVIDWVAVALLITGYFLGLNKGLGPVFGVFLWLIAAMWIGRALGPVLLKWMPNTPVNEPLHWHSQFMAYGAVTGTLLALPILAKIVGGRNGTKKKATEEVHSKHFGSLVGLAMAALFFTLACPFAHRFEAVARSYRQAVSPFLASGLADHMVYLYPDAHRQAIGQTLTGPAKAKTATPRAQDGQGAKPRRRQPTMR